jgi:hypothetical protein
MAENTDLIYQHGIAPNTRVALSQKNRVFSRSASGQGALTQIGVLSTFSYDESRSLDPVRGIGFGDRVAELVPGMTEPMSIKLNRTLLYTSGIIQELGYKGGIDGLVRSLRHHRWPFDLQTELVFSELAGVSKYKRETGSAFAKATDNVTSNAIVTRFIACWLESYSVDFSSDNAIVMEDASGKATDVTDGTGIDGRYDDTSDKFTSTGNSTADKTQSSIFVG